MKMQDGIYECIINNELKNNINENDCFIGKNKLKGPEARKLIIDYLSEVTLKALKTIEENDVDKLKDVLIKKDIEISNDIIKLLRSKLSFDEYKDLDIINDAEILEYAFSKFNNSSFDEKNIVKPITSLVEPTLFTNNSKDISLLSELKKEILSSDEVWLLVSFIRMTGIMPLLDILKSVTSCGKKIKIITTTYMKATEYNAILRLLELPNTEIKISYETNNQRLHAKAYIFRRTNGFSTFYIGSSNLSRAALVFGDEWNVKLTEKKSPDIYKNVISEFETYWNSYEYETLNNNEADLNKLRAELMETKSLTNYYENLMTYKPYDYQERILERLDVERNIYHHYKNLIVAATGVGKTVLAAFDFKKYLKENMNAKFLYVVHRQEILEKSMDTFRQILRDANFGELYVGKHKPNNINRLFTTVSGANNIAENHKSDYYDYIVIDEIHHAKADTYSKLLTYYKPKILLGLTATPERMDGKDITDYFDHNIAAEMRLPEAINKRLLVPFQYYGITDNTDLSNVRWTSFGYNNLDLDKAFINNEKRLQSIIDNLNKYIDSLDNVHGLGFCASINHAKYMADKFNENNIPSLCLTGDIPDDIRKNAIKELEDGKLKFIFTVDLYNEGVDIPCVNVELLLRPTDSLTIFLQQLGRGLRLYENKNSLTVLDFIGEANKHFNYAKKLAALIGNEEISVKDSIIKAFPLLPVGCSISLERVAESYIMANIKANISNRQRIIEALQKFEKDTGNELSLLNFLRHYEIDIYELYKKDITFYRLLTEAGIRKFNEDTELENQIVGRLKNMFKINSIKFIEYIKSILNGKNDRNNILLKSMSYYTLFNRIPSKEGFNSIDEALEMIKNSKNLNFEINEICDYLESNINIQTINNNLLFNSPLEIYGIYTQAQLFSGLGVFNDKYAGPMLQGVWYLKEHNHDIFLITLNKEESHFGESISYDDYPINEKLFNWQTQNSVSEGSETLERYIKSKGNVSLFVRVNRTENGNSSPYMYLGEADYVSHEGSKPVSIIWKLNNKIPAEYLLKMKNKD